MKRFFNKNLGNPQLFSAFTLAEVLITLGIIGLVAEMTIPTLMNNTRDKELKTAWKKAFSELSQANLQIIQENGGVDFSGQCNNFDDLCFRDLFAAKMKIIKTCTGPISGGCAAPDSKFLDNTTLDSAGIGINSDSFPAIVNQQGVSVRFRYHVKDCSWGTPWSCGWMQVDVNGLKKPNTAGKDIFFIGLLKNRLMPFGENNSPLNLSTDCAPGGKGEACSAKYLYE